MPRFSTCYQFLTSCCSPPSGFISPCVKIAVICIDISALSFLHRFTSASSIASSRSYRTGSADSGKKGRRSNTKNKGMLCGPIQRRSLKERVFFVSKTNKRKSRNRFSLRKQNSVLQPDRKAPLFSRCFKPHFLLKLTSIW